MIETQRLLLRSPDPADADAFAAQLADPEVMRFIGGVADEPPSAAVERWLARWAANGIGHFVVVRRDDGRVLGRTGFVVWDTSIWRNGTRADAGAHAQEELGWAFAREHWGRGYATEAARAARDWGRREAGVRSLISLIHADNTASRRVAEKLGCVHEREVTLESGVRCDVWVHP